jgi:hypothetical protein
MDICYYVMHYNIFILWQVLYPIGCLTLYGLTKCIINEWMNCTSSVYFAFLGLTPDPTVTWTKFWIHGMYNV